MGQTKEIVGLKELRQLLGLSQEELAVAAGITTGHLAGIEANTRKFAMGTAEKVATAMNNMLSKAICYGNEMKVACKEKELEDNFEAEACSADSIDSENYNQEVIVLPELLILGHEANFFPDSHQETAYDLMIANEVNDQRLRMMRDEGVDLPQDEILRIETKFKQDPKVIINNIIQDQYYKDGYSKVLEDLRNHMRKSSGFFLN